MNVERAEGGRGRKRKGQRRAKEEGATTGEEERTRAGKGGTLSFRSRACCSSGSQVALSHAAMADVCSHSSPAPSLNGADAETAGSPSLPSPNSVAEAGSVSPSAPSCTGVGRAGGEGALSPPATTAAWSEGVSSAIPEGVWRSGCCGQRAMQGTAPDQGAVAIARDRRWEGGLYIYRISTACGWRYRTSALWVSLPAWDVRPCGAMGRRQQPEPMSFESQHPEHANVRRRYDVYDGKYK